MTEERLVDVGRGIELCCRVDGDPTDPAILLIAGLSQQLHGHARQSRPAHEEVVV